MDTLLKEITALPKVLGCFIYSSTKGVTSSNMPPIFADNTIKVTGTLLARSKQMAHMAKLNLEAIDIRYNESMIVARPLNPDTVLVTICEPGTNRSLLDMSINLVVNDIRALLSSGQQETAGPARPKPAAGTSLRPVIAKIKEALADSIGPIAAPVLDDCLKKWSSQGPQSKERLADLAWMLCQEIDDENLETNFMESIKRYL